MVNTIQLQYQSTVFNDDRIHIYDCGNDINELKNKLIMFIKSGDVDIKRSKVVQIKGSKQFQLLTSFELQLLMINYD